jgi:putative ATPase
MTTPLADQLRPQKIEDIVGQDHLLAPGSFIQLSIEKKRPQSFILFGPPGCGKTTLARLYAKAFEARFVSLSGVFGSVSEIKKIVTDTQGSPLLSSYTLLFVDEIHRFNKAQQDAFLPFIENGLIILIGATTENPSFALNNALLSRARVLNMHSLKEEDLEKILLRCEKEQGPLNLKPELRIELKKLCQGDGRFLLNLVETLKLVKKPIETLEELFQILQRKAPIFDKEGEHHFNLISALHKSIRGSDPDASLYWLTRMLNGGEDPRYIARRLIRIASEDVGLADPQALEITLNAQKAYEILGSPEGELALAQAVVYLALSPKSNAVYKAFNRAKDVANNTSNLMPPYKILNAPTSIMKDLGYGKDYKYDHETSQGFSGQNYFPDDLERQKFYHPLERGFEREMFKRLAFFESLRKKL